MFPGGGGMNDRKMQQMMQQMGIEMQELDAEEVIIRTADEELVFTGAEVQRMDAKGQKTYTIVGDPESRPRGEGGEAIESGESADSDGAADEDAADDEGEEAIPAEDVELVAARAGVSEEQAREALAEADGDLAAAVGRLE